MVAAATAGSLECNDERKVDMNLTGNVINGMIVLDQPTLLPEGTRVEIAVRQPAETQRAARFRELVREWKAATLVTSSGTEMALHPAYQQIIGMGKEAIPLILEELQREDDHWFWALKSITGEDPVPEADRGSVPKMTQAWLQWAKRHGYLPCR
jgi:hypothetical protein